MHAAAASAPTRRAPPASEWEGGARRRVRKRVPGEEVLKVDGPDLVESIAYPQPEVPMAVCGVAVE